MIISIMSVGKTVFCKICSFLVIKWRSSKGNEVVKVQQVVGFFEVLVPYLFSFMRFLCVKYFSCLSFYFRYRESPISAVSISADFTIVRF